MFSPQNFRSKELYFQIETPLGWFFIDANSYLKEHFGMYLDEPWPWMTDSPRQEVAHLKEKEVIWTLESEKFQEDCINKIRASKLEDIFKVDENSAPLVPFRPKADVLIDTWNDKVDETVKPVWQASDFFLQLDGVDFDKLNKESTMDKVIKKLKGE